MDGTALRNLMDHPLFAQLVWLGLLILVCVLVYFVAKVVLVGAVRRLVARSQTTWDDALVRAELFLRLAHIAPALVAFYGAQAIPELGPTLATLIQRVAASLIAIAIALSVGAFLTALNDNYSAKPENRRRPIRGYVQVVKIAVFLLTALIVVSILMDRSPWLFVSGIGAMAAVLLLIFKDTILSLVASVQITSNDMVHVGDWIEMPQFGADGDVVDVALHTVKVQNWDKTITTVPTHALISGSFKNWRGMSLSGGRRIKRSLFIDVASIRFLEPEEVQSFEGFALLGDYMRRKREEIEGYNAEDGRNPEISADIRRLTNVGTLRAYIASYLRNHPKIHGGMTLLVRQLAPGPRGLPIEMYCFTNTTDWNEYESIQSDIFDHILAIVPEFGLRVFQSPSGVDIERLAAESRRVDPSGHGG
jgi:miniconductance mechanosensitive channel